MILRLELEELDQATMVAMAWGVAELASRRQAASESLPYVALDDAAADNILAEATPMTMTTADRAIRRTTLLWAR
jgi:hypothetical protein